MVDVNVAPNIVDAVVSVDEDIATTSTAFMYSITAGNDANLGATSGRCP